LRNIFDSEQRASTGTHSQNGLSFILSVAKAFAKATLLIFSVEKGTNSDIFSHFCVEGTDGNSIHIFCGKDTNLRGKDTNSNIFSEQYMLSHIFSFFFVEKARTNSNSVDLFCGKGTNSRHIQNMKSTYL